MHFEILVEGQTELTALSILMESFLGKYSQPHTWKIHKHRGIGHLPGNLMESPKRHDQTLLHNLPSKLKAYGKENRTDLVVVVLVDLDEQIDCRVFKNELVNILNYCEEKPNVLFRIAVEELEAWYLADPEAIKKAYPEAYVEKLKTYVQDSQCGTWEKLADIIYPGGLPALLTLSRGRRSPRILEQKCNWAKKICIYMNVESNASPSFQCFRDGLRKKASQLP